MTGVLRQQWARGFTFWLKAGARAPGWLLDALAGNPHQEDLEWRQGLVMLRFDQGTYADAPSLGLDLA